MHQQQPKTLQSRSKRPKSSQEQARFSQEQPRSSQNHLRSKQNQPRSSQELLKSANIKPIQTVIINWPILMSIPFLPVTSTRLPIVNSRRRCCPPQRDFNESRKNYRTNNTARAQGHGTTDHDRLYLALFTSAPDALDAILIRPRLGFELFFRIVLPSIRVVLLS